MSLANATRKAKLLRSSTAYQEWKNKVFERDKGKCVLCGSNEKIEIDHIKSLALFPQLALNIENGRVLCKKCHKKTDTYGSFSRFKNESAIHPLLAGDFLYKLQSLPTTIEINNQTLGISVIYETETKRWLAGYKGKKGINLTVTGMTAEEAIDNIYEKLKISSSSNFDLILSKISNEKIMKQASTKLFRHNLYEYIENLLNRELADYEKSKIAEFFMQAVKQYSRNLWTNNNE